MTGGMGIVAVPKNHRLAGRSRVSIEDLVGEPNGYGILRSRTGSGRNVPRLSWARMSSRNPGTPMTFSTQPTAIQSLRRSPRRPVRIYANAVMWSASAFRCGHAAGTSASVAASSGCSVSGWRSSQVAFARTFGAVGVGAPLIRSGCR